MSLRICPFTLLLFVGSAAYVTFHARSKKEEHDDTLPCCQVVFVLGGPGTGKGTQCELLSQRLKWTHLSAGDLLREERKRGGKLGDEINACISAGKLVPSEVTCKLLEQAMKAEYKATKKSTKFLIDGFPRSFGNATAWQTTMSHHKVEFVLELNAPEEVLVGRLLARGKTSGRADDTMDVIRKRFATAQQETLPIVQEYEKQGKLRKVASDQPVEDVYKQVAALFQGLSKL
jgi:UMP-CMP kinase